MLALLFAYVSSHIELILKSHATLLFFTGGEHLSTRLEQHRGVRHKTNSFMQSSHRCACPLSLTRTATSPLSTYLQANASAQLTNGSVLYARILYPFTHYLYELLGPHYSCSPAVKHAIGGGLYSRLWTCSSSIAFRILSHDMVPRAPVHHTCSVA